MLFPLVEGPACGHHVTVDNETKIDHDMGYLGISFVILKADAPAGHGRAYQKGGMHSRDSTAEWHVSLGKE